jgi:hypothetical protein
LIVTPAQAGVSCRKGTLVVKDPAFAGMTI